MLQHAPSVARFRVDAAETDISKVDRLTILSIFDELVMNKVISNQSYLVFEVIK